MCEFQYLYLSEDGFVVRCKHCGYYQVAFISTMLLLSEHDFQELCDHVKFKYTQENEALSKHCKSVVIQTLSQGACLLLTRGEAEKFYEILETAASEVKALELIRLFNKN